MNERSKGKILTELRSYSIHVLPNVTVPFRVYISTCTVLMNTLLSIRQRNIMFVLCLALPYYIYIYVCVCVCVYIYIYMCVCVCVYIYMCVCVCVYIYIYIRGLLETYPTFGREKETGLLGALDT